MDLLVIKDALCYSLKFDTEQRRNFKGVDINDFPAPKPIIKDNNIYLPPSVKFETNTNQKVRKNFIFPPCFFYAKRSFIYKQPNL